MISENIKEVFEKINRDRFVVGLDINDSFAQVSYCKVDSDAPTTLSLSEESEEFNVPLFMLKRRDDGAWLFGNEAKVGDSITLLDYMKKTLQAKGQLDKAVKQWAEKGTVVEFVEDKAQPFNSKYVIKAIAK